MNVSIGVNLRVLLKEVRPEFRIHTGVEFLHKALLIQSSRMLYAISNTVQPMDKINVPISVIHYKDACAPMISSTYIRLILTM